LFASGVAVSLAILAMSLTRSLHPPGGAAALTAVIRGHAVTSAGYMFALTPVAINSAVVVLVAISFHRLAGTNYPHRTAAVASQHGTTDPPAYTRVGFSPSDIDVALASMGEAFDIDRDDLALLLRHIELQALSRSLGSPTCGDIMSRDVVTIGLDASTEQAIDALLAHDIRTLPVVDDLGHLQGTVGLRDLIGKPPSTLRHRLFPAITVSPTQGALELLGRLSDGRHHAVIVVASGNEILGIVSQSDLLMTTSRSWAG
jgi:CBS domain-containing membrane protein